MCCFTGPVSSVTQTKIFARAVHGGAAGGGRAVHGGATQLLVYGMTVSFDADLAMVLPIPVPPGSPDDAVRFVDLSSSPDFFDDVAVLFNTPMPHGMEPLRAFGASKTPKLVVHDVGDFEASFVPARADVARLDARFRLSDDVWRSLPQYDDWGFAVFKLRKTRARGLWDRIAGVFGGGGAPIEAPGPRVQHPMAFEFPRRDPSALFFPTVHVHDGTVKDTAWFDHRLFCQLDGDPSRPSPEGFAASRDLALAVAARSQKWLRLDAPIHQRLVQGHHPNRDIVVPA